MSALPAVPRTVVSRVLHALVLCGLLASLATAVTPFDFAGQWVGRGSDHHGPFTITAILTATGANTFGGTVVTENTGTCSVTGKRRRNHVTLRLVCAAKSIAGSAHLDVATQTLTGGFAYVGSHGHHLRHATFTLTKSAP